MADLQDRTRVQHARPGVGGEALARSTRRAVNVPPVVHFTANANRPRSAR